MFTTLFAHDTGQASPREGDLYKQVTVAGKTFDELWCVMESLL